LCNFIIFLLLIHNDIVLDEVSWRITQLKSEPASYIK